MMLHRMCCNVPCDIGFALERPSGQVTLITQRMHRNCNLLPSDMHVVHKVTMDPLAERTSDMMETTAGRVNR